MLHKRRQKYEKYPSNNIKPCFYQLFFIKFLIFFYFLFGK